MTGGDGMDERKRITFTLKPIHDDMMGAIAEATGKSKGAVAHEMVSEILDGFIVVLQESKPGEDITSDAVLKRLFRLSLSRLMDAIVD